MAERAGVAELVYAQRSERCPERVGGSSPLICTKLSLVKSSLAGHRAEMAELVYASRIVGGQMAELVYAQS